jgi:hypothetical protein
MIGVAANQQSICTMDVAIARDFAGADLLRLCKFE